jgi:hypothetical protein
MKLGNVLSFFILFKICFNLAVFQFDKNERVNKCILLIKYSKTPVKQDYQNELENETKLFNISKSILFKR